MFSRGFVILHPADAIQTDRFFSRLEPFRQLATRYEKTASRNDVFYNGVAPIPLIVSHHLTGLTTAHFCAYDKVNQVAVEFVLLGDKQPMRCSIVGDVGRVGQML